MITTVNRIAVASAFLFGISLGVVAFDGGAEAAQKKQVPRSSVVKPPAIKQPALTPKKPPTQADCTKAFSPGTYKNDPDHAKYYCKTTGLLCAAPYQMDKVEFKPYVNTKRLYYTCRISTLTNSQSVSGKLCDGPSGSYFQNSMSAPNPSKHYFYYCISAPIACSSSNYTAQTWYTKISSNVGLGRYDCKYKY